MVERPLKPLEPRERTATRVWAIAFAILYWLTRTETHSTDALLYAHTVRDGSWLDQLHPHHLLYNALIRILWKAACVAHPHMDPLVLAGFLNCVAAGLLLLVFSRMLLENGATFFWTSFATFGLGFSQCLWTLSGENEVYVGALLLVVMAARRGLRLARSSLSSDALLTGLAIAAAGSLHLAASIFLLPVLVVTWFSQPGIRQAWTRSALVALGVLAPVGLAYGAVALWGHPDAMGWMNHYMRWDSWLDRNPIRVALGFLWFLRGAVPDFGLIGRAPAPTSSALLNDLAQVPFILFSLAVVYLIWDGWKKRPYLTWRFGPFPLMCLAWFLTFEVFLGWVGHSSLKFWTLTLPPLWGFVAIWGDLRFGDPEGEGLRRMSRWAAGGTLLMLILMVVTTGFLVVAPRHDQRKDMPRRWSQNIAHLTMPRDFLLVPDGELQGYLLFYGRRSNMFSMENLAAYARPYNAALDTLEVRMAATRSSGNRSFLLGTGMVITPFAAQLWNRPQDARELYRHFEGRLRPVANYSGGPLAPGPDGWLGLPVLLEVLPADSIPLPADSSATVTRVSRR